MERNRTAGLGRKRNRAADLEMRRNLPTGLGGRGITRRARLGMEGNRLAMGLMTEWNRAAAGLGT